MENNINIDYRVEKLEEGQKEMREKQAENDAILFEIRTGIAKIAEELKSNNEKVDLKNQLFAKDVDEIKHRVEKLETNQRWVVTSVIGEVLAIIFGIIMFFIKKGM